MLALPDAARCRSMRPAPRADDMRPRPRRAAGLPEVQEGWQAPGCNAAPACPALAPAAAAGKLNAKLKSDFRCYPNNGHAATASAGPFCANKRLMHRSNLTVYSITSSASASTVGGISRLMDFAVLRLSTNK